MAKFANGREKNLKGKGRDEKYEARGNWNGREGQGREEALGEKAEGKLGNRKRYLRHEINWSLEIRYCGVPLL